MRVIGKILWWNDRDGFGVIEDMAGNEFYFDSSAVSLRSGQTVARRQMVLFDINPNIKDCPCARRVQISSASERKRSKKRWEKSLSKMDSA